MIALHASDETFPNDEPVKTLKVDVTANQAIGTFENLTQGEYAISLFHDENSNGELDKNLMGIPKEPFGFSNDEMGMFGPPSFNKCVIVVSPNEDIQTTITLKSM